MITTLSKHLGPIPDKRRRKPDASQVVSIGGIQGTGNHNHQKKKVDIKFHISSDGKAMRINAEVPLYDISFSMPTEDNEPEVLYAAATAAIKAKMTFKGFHVHNMDFVASTLPARTHTATVTP